jgi:RimJ/RimL family protein N-acetyltransferase
VIAASRWSRGYATEIAGALLEHAFRVLGLRRLIALIHPGNHASEKVALRAGMRLDKEISRPGGGLRRVFVLARQDSRYR